MGKDSKIEWTDHTFNPWWGCVKTSEGCKNCYAETMSKRFGDWWGIDGERRFFGEKHWNEPLKWNRQAEKNGTRFKVFCGSMCDVFEKLPSLFSNDSWIKLIKEQHRLKKLIKETPNLDWLLLTKRLENVEELTYYDWCVDDKWPKNVWLGTSVENQEQVDIRIPQLMRIPTKVRFLSVEPMLEEINLKFIDKFDTSPKGNTSIWRGMGIDWVIVGGESGTNKRPFNTDWARSIRDQCKEADVPFFFKQVDKIRPIPDDLMIREFPQV